MANTICLDINGNPITEFIFTQDGTVLGVERHNAKAVDSGYGPPIGETTTSQLLSAECCRALGFNYNNSNMQCYYRDFCNPETTDEDNPDNVDIIDAISDIDDLIASDIKILGTTDNSQLKKEANNRILNNSKKLDFYKSQLQRRDIKLIFGAEGNNPVLFTVNGAQGDLTTEQEIECSKLLKESLNQIDGLNNSITETITSINNINERITNISNEYAETGNQELLIRISNLEEQRRILNEHLNSLRAELALLQANYDTLYLTCNPIPPECKLDVSFNYLWNFDCEDLLNCGAGDNSQLSSLQQQQAECLEIVESLTFRIGVIRREMDEIAISISSTQTLLASYEAQLVNNFDPISVYQIESSINNINAELISLVNQYNNNESQIETLQAELALQQDLCERINLEISIIELYGNLISVLQNVVFYFTIEKKVPLELPPSSSSTTPLFNWETIYEEEFFRIDDLLTHIRNNPQTGIYFSGDKCNELIQNISILLGQNCDAISANTFNSQWLTFATSITDNETILKMINEEITFGIRISYESPGCEYCFLIDRIQMNQICEVSKKVDVVVTKCPGFELERIIDNKKSWVNINSGHTREFDFETRETSYSLIHDDAVINSKEIDLEVGPASAIEYDVYNYIYSHPCLLSGNTEESNFLNLIDTEISAITTINEFRNIFNSQLIDAKSSKIYSSYPTLQAIYERYLNSSQYCTGTTSNAYTYCDMVEFGKLLGNYWVDLIEQVIPATTMWGSTYKYKNSMFDNNRFQYKPYSLNYCKPFDTICDVNSGSTANVNVIIEDISKETNSDYPSCYISPSNSTTCNYLQTIDYDNSCEYIGRVIIVNAPNDSDDNTGGSVVSGGGVIVIDENVNYYINKI